MKKFKTTLLLSPIFVIGLALLLVNDFYLKAEFHNFLTGKISDFAGLFIFPFFFAVFFPNKTKQIYFSTAILFVFWKLPFSDLFIDIFNSNMFFSINRVVDFTDLTVLLILPISYFYFNYRKQKEISVSLQKLKFIFANFVILLSVFAFSATSYEQDRSVPINKEYKIFIPVDVIKERISKNPKVEIISFDSKDNLIEVNGNFIFDKKISSTFVYLEVKGQICEKEFTRFSFSLDKNNTTNVVDLNYLTASFWCENKPDEKAKMKSQKLFEDEITSKIMQNKSQ